ncbi:MAG: hypothetical protein PUA47_07335 [Bacteroidales bacterium]|nr:hypothetical protein [Bacteroidales bacterium]
MNAFPLHISFRPVLLAAVLLLCATGAAAQDDKKAPDILESCELEADRLQRLLDLEDWQAFRVDSTLKHDYPAMNKEMEELRSSKISNSDIYQGVQDKWMEKIDESYRRIFTDEQWNRYLKQGAARAIAARQKRYAKLNRR